MKPLPKLNKIQIMLKIGGRVSMHLNDVYSVSAVAEYFHTQEFEDYVIPLIKDNAMYFVWIRMMFADGTHMDSPISHFIGDRQVSAATWRALYDASNR